MMRWPGHRAHAYKILVGKAEETISKTEA